MYDAYILLKDIDIYHYTHNKQAFIEFNTRQIKEFITTEIDSKNQHIIIKN